MAVVCLHMCWPGWGMEWEMLPVKYIHRDFYTERLFAGGRKGISIRNCGAQERRGEGRMVFVFLIRSRAAVCC